MVIVEITLSERKGDMGRKRESGYVESKQVSCKDYNLPSAWL